jgi:hypothetical protein
VPAYGLFSDTAVLGRMALGRMLAGLSTRRYVVGLETQLGMPTVRGHPLRPLGSSAGGPVAGPPAAWPLSPAGDGDGATDRG